MSKKTNPPKRSRLKKIGIGIVIALVLYAITGFFIIPAVIKSQFASQGEKLLNKRASLERVYINPFTFYFEAEGLELGEVDGEDLLSLKHMHVDFELSSIFKGAFYFKEIYVVELDLKLKIYPDEETGVATNNFQETLNALREIKVEIPTVQIGDFQVADVRVGFSDTTLETPFSMEVFPASVTLTNFTTKPEIENPYEVKATASNGESVEVSGTLVVHPIDIKGTAKVANVRPGNFKPYYAQFTTADIADGVIALGATYELDTQGENVDIKVSDAYFSYNDLDIRDPESGESLIKAPLFEVTGASASYVDRSIDVPTIVSRDAVVNVALLEDKTLNLLNLITLPEASAENEIESQLAEEAPSAPEESEDESTSPIGWNVRVGSFAIENHTISATDQSISPAANVLLDQFGVKLTEITLDEGAKIPITVSGRLNEQSGLRVTGEFSIFPISANLSVNLADFDFTPYQTYAGDAVNADLLSGTVSVDVTATASMPTPDALTADATANVIVNDLQIAEKGSTEPLIKIASVNVSNAKANLEPLSADVENVTVTDLQTELVLAADGGINLLKLLPPSANAETPTEVSPVPDAAPANALPPFTLGTFTLTNAVVQIRDESFNPPFSSELENFNGTVQNITTDPAGETLINFSGLLADTGELRIDGKAMPLAETLSATVHVALQALNLPPFAGYSGKFVGHPISSGSVSVDTTASINGETLESANNIVLDNLEFGDRLPDSEAPNLPVKFGVSMLKDSNGNIELDVPITGDLNDPSFNIAGVVSQQIGQILRNVASSPFKVLGSIVGGGDDVELSFVSFDPGSATLPDIAISKLETLSKGLKERPQLSLEILPKSTTDEDRNFFLEQELQKLLTEYAPIDMTSTNAVPDASKTLVGQERDDAIRSAYEGHFTLETDSEASDVEPEDAIAADDESTEVKRPNFIVRSWRWTKNGIVDLFTKDDDEVDSSGESLETDVEVTATDLTPEEEMIPEEAVPEITVEEMEEKLVSTLTIDEAVLAALPSQRAAAVQTYLIETGQINASRISTAEEIDDEPDLRVHLALE